LSIQAVLQANGQTGARRRNRLRRGGCPCQAEKAVVSSFVSNGPLLPFDAGKPSVARAYDYTLGGKDNFAADREQLAEVMEVFPLAAVLARENRQFLARAVGYVARHGVAQFIDVGSGLPASPAVHEIADAARPGAGRELSHHVHRHQQRHP
jgi:hypothetical protein